MLNKEQHTGLPNESIRDLFSEMLNEIDKSLLLNNPQKFYHNRDTDDIFNSRIKNSEEIIRCEKVKMSLYKKQQAIFELMKHWGWEDLDSSDETSKGYDGSWLLFIGTQEEFNKQFKK